MSVIDVARPTIHRTRARKALVIGGVAAILALGAWRFPPFHIVPLKGVQDQQQAAQFDAAAAAAAFWQGKLLPATGGAVEAKELISAWTKDVNLARQLQDGAVGSRAFLVKGTGRVTTVEEEAVVIVVDGTHTKVRLSTGLLFGNTVRDATGLLDVSAYPNSQDFNDLSTELNKIVEAKIVPALREKAAVGKVLRFFGCAELEEGAKPDSLSVVPLRIEWS